MADFDWKHPDYAPIWKERTERLERIRAETSLIPALKEFYKDNPIKFITDWGCTFDPRNPEMGLEAVVPFVLFPKQEEFVTFVFERWRAREDWLCEKSRDMGLSWLCVAIACHLLIFHPGTVTGFGSRKEEYVDKLGDPKSLFWKARKYLELLPREFRPNYEAPHMRIVNSDNGSSIVGEAGDNIGRGNRTSVYFKDESAFYERPEAIDAALSQTSNCKGDVSTVNGNGNPFYRKRHSGKVKVFTFHWKDDPRKDEAWYQKQKESLDPVIVAQEIDIDYNASSTDAFIAGDKVQEAMSRGPGEIEVNGPWVVAIDAAHYGDDESVVHFRRGRLNLPQKTYRKIDGPELAARVEDEIGYLLAMPGSILSAIVIELDGPGVSCYDTLKRGKYKDFVVGVHTGSREKDNKNYNLRAKMWRNAHTYLEEGGVCLHNDAEFKSQICSVKYRYKDGLLLMQDKKEYKKDYGKSPDRADAFVLTFTERVNTASEPLKRNLRGII